MRKLLLSSVVLSIFAIALTVFQMSCKKEATAQQTSSNYTLPAATTSTLGGVIIGNGLSVTTNGTLSVNSTDGNYTLPAGTTSTLGGFIVGNGLSVTSNGTLSVNPANGLKQLGKILLIKSVGSNQTFAQEAWTASYDGTNLQKINIPVPNGLSTPYEIDAKLSPDGQIVFISFYNSSFGRNLYSCKIDGTDMRKIASDSYNIQGAY